MISMAKTTKSMVIITWQSVPDGIIADIRGKDRIADRDRECPIHRKQINL